MKDLIFITGNQHKADYLAKWLQIPVEHQNIDLTEIQSLDIHDVVNHKARSAYDIVKRPVLVEDLALSFTAMGQLPGTFIKWFIGELGLEGLCELAKSLPHSGAVCTILYALYDGTTMPYFEANQQGTITDKPLGSGGFGWNAIFQPQGSKQTYGEMDEKTFAEWNIRAHAIKKLQAYLTSQE